MSEYERPDVLVALLRSVAEIDRRFADPSWADSVARRLADRLPTADPRGAGQSSSPSPASGTPRVSISLPGQGKSASELVDEIAERVAERVAERLQGQPASAGADTVRPLLSPAELARRLGRSRDWVYAHGEELGVIRLGDGARPRLWYDWA